MGIRRAIAISIVACCADGLYQPACGAESHVLRVLSYNIRHGEGLDGRIDLARLAQVIRAARPDLVALQEVDQGVRRSGGVDQPAELARLTGLRAVFGKNVDHDGGNYGNAVLTRLPIVDWHNVPLPSHYQGEQRGALAVVVDLGAGHTVRLVATHLDHRPNDAERLASAALLNDLLRGKWSDCPTVLAGDLNAIADSAVLKRFKERWNIAMRENGPLDTYPAAEPAKQIDYVLFSPPSGWRTVAVEVVAEPMASDHRPILAVLEAAPASRSGRGN